LSNPKNRRKNYPSRSAVSASSLSESTRKLSGTIGVVMIQITRETVVALEDQIQFGAVSP
jgi:hypothetical protein